MTPEQRRLFPDMAADEDKTQEQIENGTYTGPKEFGPAQYQESAESRDSLARAYSELLAREATRRAEASTDSVGEGKGVKARPGSKGRKRAQLQKARNREGQEAAGVSSS